MSAMWNRHISHLLSNDPCVTVNIHLHLKMNKTVLTAELLFPSQLNCVILYRILIYCTCLVHEDAFFVLSLLSTLDVSVSELQPPVEPTEWKKDAQVISHCIEPNVNGVERTEEFIDKAWKRVCVGFKTAEPIILTVSFPFAYN